VSYRKLVLAVITALLCISLMVSIQAGLVFFRTLTAWTATSSHSVRFGADYGTYVQYLAHNFLILAAVSVVVLLLFVGTILLCVARRRVTLS
jgi:hypothetical protein